MTTGLARNVGAEMPGAQADVDDARPPQGSELEPCDDPTPRRPSFAAVAALAGSAAALVASAPLHDNSFLTHLATGRLLISDGLPAQNPFLYTGTGFPVPSWWWSSMLAVAEELGGATGIRLLTAVVAAAVGAVLVRLTRPADGDLSQVRVLTAALPALLALGCVFIFLSGRPHLVGFLLLALTVLVWHEERSAWWLVPIFTIWVNVHGSWLFGLGLLGIFGAARAIDDRRVRPADFWRVAAAVLGTGVGGALYPDRFELLLLPTRQIGDPVEREALSVYGEWSPVSFGNPALWLVALLGLTAVWGCVRNRRYAMAVVSFGLVAMAASGGRFIPVAAVSLVPFAALAVAGFGSIPMPSGRAARVVAGLSVVVAASAVLHSTTGDGYLLDMYPVAAVDWLEERELVGTVAVRVVSHDYVGNYLGWRFGDRAHAYVDDRPDAATLVDYGLLLHVEPGWTEALERARPDVVLWSSEKPLVEELQGDQGWVRAVELDDFTVFCRAGFAARCR